MKYLVTGAAGFIGFHVASRLLGDGHEVCGIDNLNDYYDVRLKKDRLTRLEGFPGFSFSKIDISDRTQTTEYFDTHSFDRVIHLAAQAGVTYSLSNPHKYVESNVLGTLNILEGCRTGDVNHLVYASSSSVYGLNSKMPFSEYDNVDHPVSFYAATKKSSELMAHTYSHLYGLPVTGLRFFTVYGPWGRPDMAYFVFTEAIFKGQPIKVFNNGDMKRDFTYIDDIVEGIVRVADNVPEPDPKWSPENPNPASSSAPYRLYNIGNHNPVNLMEFIKTIEDAVGKKAVTENMPMRQGEVPVTFADISSLQIAIEFKPSTPLKDGIEKFVEWYREYYLQ